jgi:hypothetical protein
MTGYQGTPSTVPADAVRFWIQDTDTTDYEFTDAEIAYLLTQYTDPILAARFGCQILANKYSKEVNESLGELSESSGQKATAYAARAKELEEIYNRGVMAGNLITMPSSPPKCNDSTYYPSRMQYGDIADQKWDDS